MNTLELYNLPLYWEMVNAEKIALLNLLNDIKPATSIEIGTKKGGNYSVPRYDFKTIYGSFDF